ncbi:protein phosphatase 2C domain-containing protein [Streptomyces erythrochromogenes]|uniref:protein phosphatase 2C domain-containing protein n=1 Tax=Streptomyces erythrochromogenes TaxID=285574 RepID=UPI003682F353
MSQQGADDWWQKLYEDPEGGPAPDPGDTLDHRFRSAAGVTGDPDGAPPPEPVREADPGRGPGRGPLPAPRPEPDAGPPARSPLPDTVRREPARPPVAGPVPAPRPAPDALPASPAEQYVPPPVPAAPPAVPPTAEGAAPGARSVPPATPAPPVAGDAPAGPPAPPAVPPSREWAPPGDRSVPPPGPALDQPAVQVPLPGEAYGPPPARAPLPGETAGADPAPGAPADVPAGPPRAPAPAERNGPPPVPQSAPRAADGATSGPGFGPFAPPPTRGLPSGAPTAPASPPHGPPPAAPPGERYGPPPPPAPPWHGAQPRDPRTGGATGYALGGVEVPPAPGPELPTRRAQAPRPEDRTAEVPQPAPPPPPEPVRAPAGAPAQEAAAPQQRPEVRHLGDRAPTYAAEPGPLPPADPAALDALVPDTVLEGARYGDYTLRAASLRGDSARYRGESRRDFLLTARFGSGDDALVLVALAGGDRAAPGAAEAAAELCRTVAAAVGRSQGRLADDIRAGRRDALRSGLQRLTDRGYGRLRARAAELGLAEEEYTAGLRGLLLPVDPECRTRVCFGSGAGGLFRLRSGQWQDLEPTGPAAPAPAPAADAAEPADAVGEPGSIFRFRASVARPGDILLLCSGGLAEPMREEAALQAELAARWAEPEPPGLAAFLADTQLRLKGYADDRTAAAVWEA